MAQQTYYRPTFLHIVMQEIDRRIADNFRNVDTLALGHAQMRFKGNDGWEKGPVVFQIEGFEEYAFPRDDATIMWYHRVERIQYVDKGEYGNARRQQMQADLRVVLSGRRAQLNGLHELDVVDRLNHAVNFDMQNVQLPEYTVSLPTFRILPKAALTNQPDVYAAEVPGAEVRMNTETILVAMLYQANSATYNTNCYEPDPCAPSELIC